MPRHKDKYNDVLGMFAPERLYTARGAFRHGGLDPGLLVQGRDAGFLHPINVHGMNWYRGSKLIEWIMAHQRPEPIEMSPDHVEAMRSLVRRGVKLSPEEMGKYGPKKKLKRRS